MHKLQTLRQIISQNLARTSEQALDLGFAKARGVNLYDLEGRAYMDLISGISVSNFGHCNRHINRAIKKQVDSFAHLMVYGEYAIGVQALLAQKIVEKLHRGINAMEGGSAHCSNLEKVYFVNSGSEAIEGAIKIAKKHTSRKGIVAFRNSYHGSTHGALSILGSEKYRAPYEPLLPNVTFLDLNALEQLSSITDETACVVIELVQAEAGVVASTQSFIDALKARCSQTGTLIIVDEVQTGMHRTGPFCCFEGYQLVPDILVLAKALGAGMPLGAFISSEEIMSVVRTNPPLGHITTFGGHPVSCAASLAAFELLTENFISAIEQKSRLFLTLLQHPKIKPLRSAGLLIALDFGDQSFNKRVMDMCIERRLLVDYFLHNSNSLRLAPPLTITRKEIAKACGIILEVLDKL